MEHEILGGESPQRPVNTGWPSILTERTIEILSILGRPHEQTQQTGIHTLSRPPFFIPASTCREMSACMVHVLYALAYAIRGEVEEQFEGKTSGADGDREPREKGSKEDSKKKREEERDKETRLRKERRKRKANLMRRVFAISISVHLNGA